MTAHSNSNVVDLFNFPCLTDNSDVNLFIERLFVDSQSTGSTLMFSIFTPDDMYILGEGSSYVNTCKKALVLHNKYLGLKNHYCYSFGDYAVFYALV